MRLVGRDVLDRFCSNHADCRKWIGGWVLDVTTSEWRIPQDIKSRYASASFLADNVVIFNVRGNEYRLATHVAYKTHLVIAEWIGTHAEYMKKYSK